MARPENVLRIDPDAIKRIAASDTASFEKPMICGHFSLDKNRAFVADTSNLAYFYPRRNVSKHNALDLNAGIATAVRKGELCERLDHLLEWIKQSAARLDTDFVCYRGLLTKVMCSLYSDGPWSVLATKWNGVIYLCEQQLPQEYNVPEDEMNKFCSWGYKFEQYMVTDTFGKEPDTSRPVLESEEFCCVFRSKLDGHRLLYGAEMDAVRTGAPLDESKLIWNELEFVELKTSKEVRSARDDRTLRKFKFVKWWAQCYLANVADVYCGFRDARGLVTELRHYKVRQLPREAKGEWDWRACLNFCRRFLTIVKSVIPGDTNCPHSVWKLEWSPRERHLQIDEFGGRSHHSFLPDWYIDHMNSKFRANIDIL